MIFEDELMNLTPEEKAKLDAETLAKDSHDKEELFSLKRARDLVHNAFYTKRAELLNEYRRE